MHTNIAAPGPIRYDERSADGHSPQPPVLTVPSSPICSYQFDDRVILPRFLDADYQPIGAVIPVQDRTAAIRPPDQAHYLKALYLPPDPQTEPLWVTTALDRSQTGVIPFTRQAAQDNAWRSLQRLLRLTREHGFSCPDELGRSLVQIFDAAAGQTETGFSGWEGLLRAAVATGDALERCYAESLPIATDARIGVDISRMYAGNPNKFLEALRGLGLNSATITFYPICEKLADFEPVEGDYRFDLRDAQALSARRLGLQLFVRPLVWNHSCVTPAWLAAMDFDRLMAYARRRATAIIRHYQGLQIPVAGYEIINEAHDWANVQHFLHDELVELTTMLCELVAELHPGALRIINTTAPFAGYLVEGKTEDGHAVADQHTPYTYLRELVRRGVPFDITGTQRYTEYHSLADHVADVERLRALGKPVYITELGVRGGQDETHWWKGWDRARQAKWVENLYAVFLPRTWGISYYDFGGNQEYQRRGGLLFSSGKPTPAYFALQSYLERRCGKPGARPAQPHTAEQAVAQPDLALTG